MLTEKRLIPSTQEDGHFLLCTVSWLWAGLQALGTWVSGVRGEGGWCLIGPHWSQVKRAGSSIVESLVRLPMEGTRSVYS